MFCGYCGKENAEDYSFCTGCGKLLEGRILNQPIQREDKPKNLNTSSQENQDTESREKSVPQSKYLSVTWWKEGPWPWQARSLDGRTLLGSFETEVKAAEVVAKFHGINSIDLLDSRHAVENKIEEKGKLLSKEVLEKNDNPSEKNKAPKVAFEDYLSFDSPQVVSLSETSSTPMPIRDEQDLHQENTPTQETTSTNEPNIKEHIKAAVGGKEYYVDQFVAFIETGAGIKSWNWAAFLVGPFWFLYRKVYSLFLILLFASLAEYGVANASDSAQLFTALISLIAWVYCTIYANQAYYQKVTNRIEKIEILYPDSKSKQITLLKNTPMVNTWLIYVSWGIGVLAILSTAEGKQRLQNGAEGAIFGTIGAGLFWLLGAVIKSITGKEIRTGTGYIVAMGVGFAARHALISILAD